LGTHRFPDRPSVEEGHLFASALPALEMNDAAEVWVLLSGRPLSANKVAEALNALPQRLVSRDENRTAPARDRLGHVGALLPTQRRLRGQRLLALPAVHAGASGRRAPLARRSRPNALGSRVSGRS
jgi:hypothetical protein